MRTYLVLGRDEDLCCRLVCHELTRAGYDVRMVYEDQLFPHLQFAWSPHDDLAHGSIGYRDWQARFADIGGILMRGYSVPVAPEDFDTKDGRYISAEWHALLVAWMRKMPCPVVNRLRPDLWYKTHLNVTDLRSLAPDLGFRPPRTLVTTRVDDARAFIQSASGAAWYAPITQPNRYPIRNEDDCAKLLHLDGTLPFQVTEDVDGRQLDAYVVGDDVVLVNTQGVGDILAPAAVSAACVEVGRSLGLAFYRLSLVDGNGGDWYCLGLDRMPQLYACDEAVQRQLAGALARLLTNGGRTEA